MIYNFFDKKISCGTVKIKIMLSQRPIDLATWQLAEELHEANIRKFKKRKVESSFIDNICSADLVDMQIISKFNKRFNFLLCVIDIYRKYV